MLDYANIRKTLRRPDLKTVEYRLNTHVRHELTLKKSHLTRALLHYIRVTTPYANLSECESVLQ